MSIASEITRLQGVKSDILAAIAAKGVTVPAGSTLADCADLIAQIGGGPVPAYTYSLLLNWVNNVGPTPIWSGYGSDWKVLTEYIQGMNDSSVSDASAFYSAAPSSGIQVIRKQVIYQGFFLFLPL